MDSLISKPLESRLRERILPVVEASPTLKKTYRRRTQWDWTSDATNLPLIRLIRKEYWISFGRGMAIGVWMMIFGNFATSFVKVMMRDLLNYELGLTDWFVAYIATLGLTLAGLVCVWVDHKRLNQLRAGHIRVFGAFPVSNRALFKTAWTDHARYSAVQFLVFCLVTLGAVALLTTLGLSLFPTSGFRVDNLALLFAGLTGLWVAGRTLTLGFSTNGRQGTFRRMTGLFAMAGIAWFLAFVFGRALHVQEMTLSGWWNLAFPLLCLPTIWCAVTLGKQIAGTLESMLPEDVISVAQPEAKPIPMTASSTNASEAELAALAIRARLFEESRRTASKGWLDRLTDACLTADERGAADLWRTRKKNSATREWAIVFGLALTGVVLVTLTNLISAGNFTVRSINLNRLISIAGIALTFITGSITIFFPLAPMVRSVHFGKNQPLRRGTDLRMFYPTYPISTSTLVRTLLKKMWLSWVASLSIGTLVIFPIFEVKWLGVFIFVALSTATLPLLAMAGWMAESFRGARLISPYTGLLAFSVLSFCILAGTIPLAFLHALGHPILFAVPLIPLVINGLFLMLFNRAVEWADVDIRFPSSGM